jgi:hypothetical protein
MAIAMSFAMSLVMTTARLGFTAHLASAWLTSFAIGVIVAIPTAILVAPRAQQLVGHLTGAPSRSVCGEHHHAPTQDTAHRWQREVQERS